MRIYPSAEQVTKIDKVFQALHIAYNMTFHEVFQKNPMVCTKPNQDDQIWPDFKAMIKKEWRHQLIEWNPVVEMAPSEGLMTNDGLFITDAKRAWETGMHNLPINKVNRKDFHFYNAGNPRRSFVCRMPAKNIQLSSENGKVAWLKIPKIGGKIKARGFNSKIWFGPNGEYTATEAIAQGYMQNKLLAKVSKDTCGDYYISITFSEGKKQDYEVYRERVIREHTEPIGIDVGVKDVAILSDGKKYVNQHFKKKKENALKKMNRQLSRRWGYANMAFRDYNKDVRERNQSLSENEKLPLAQPSKSYLKIKKNKARLERKIARQRETYYHQITAEIVNRADMIATETLRIKNMFKNHRLAYALADAAMSDFLDKLKYKAKRSGVEIKTVGQFEATSQICNKCGFQNKTVKSLSIRTWVCPKCGEEHDRDINAAKNILAMAQRKKTVVDKEVKNDSPPMNKKLKTRKSKCVILEEKPDIVVRYSKELTKTNDPRYVIVNKHTNEVIDDAQGAGYKSISKAKNCYKAKIKWSQKQNNK